MKNFLSSRQLEGEGQNGLCRGRGKQTGHNRTAKASVPVFASPPNFHREHESSRGLLPGTPGSLCLQCAMGVNSGHIKCRKIDKQEKETEKATVLQHQEKIPHGFGTHYLVHAGSH